jgi:hypothetical protein
MSILIIITQSIAGVILGRLFYVGIKFTYRQITEYLRRRAIERTMASSTVVTGSYPDGRIWSTSQTPDGKTVVKSTPPILEVIKSNAKKVVKPKASIQNLDEIF